MRTKSLGTVSRGARLRAGCFRSDQSSVRDQRKQTPEVPTVEVLVAAKDIDAAVS